MVAGAMMDATDGWPADKVFDASVNGLGFDDIVLMPGHVSFEASEVDMGSRLTRNITLRTPLVGAAHDSVTEWKMATELALIGSLGIIHANQFVASQVEMVKRVKRYIGGFVLDPITLGPENTVADLDRLKRDQGVGSVPITENGKLGGKLIGWVGVRETQAEMAAAAAAAAEAARVKKPAPQGRGAACKLHEIMVRRVSRGEEPLSIEEAMDSLRKAKVGKLPIVDAEGRLVTMVTRSDFKKIKENPLMMRSAGGQLMVGAAVLAGAKDAKSRASELVGVGADLLFVDCRSGSSDAACELIKALKAELPQVDVLAGPAVSCREAKRLAEAGVDGLLIGGEHPPAGDFFGGVAAVGRPEATTLYEVSRYTRLLYKIPVVAGPGVRDVGQVLKALSLGASAVLLDAPLMGSDDAPGEQVLQNGAWMKFHHSQEPTCGGRARLALKHMPDVVSRHVGALVPRQGPARELVRYMLQGLRNGMQDLGIRNVVDLHSALDNGDLRLECRSPFAVNLSHAGVQALHGGSQPLVRPLLAPIA